MTITALRTSLEAARRALTLSEEQLSGIDLGAAPDTAVLQVMNEAASVRRLLDARTALLAAEVARRSSRDLGHAGLAQRLGHRTAEELVRVTTGSSRHDARIAVRAGALLGSRHADPAALESLANHTPALDVDRLHAHARQLRNELDASEIEHREQQLRAARSLRVSRGRDGMTRAVWMLSSIC